MLLGFIIIFLSLIVLVFFVLIYLKFYLIEIKFMCVVFNIPSQVYNYFFKYMFDLIEMFYFSYYNYNPPYTFLKNNSSLQSIK